MFESRPEYPVASNGNHKLEADEQFEDEEQYEADDLIEDEEADQFDEFGPDEDDNLEDCIDDYGYESREENEEAALDDVLKIQENPD